MRIDKLVVERGVVSTREKAKRLILAGEVLVDDAPVDKPGTLVPRDASVRLRQPLKPFVGRGGEKLSGALAHFELNVAGLNVLDVGASTGGFTDCLLQAGARQVTALDVGQAQLDWKVASDPRVVVADNVNARYVERADFPRGFDLITADVAFISLTKILGALVPLLEPHGRMLLLVKPQFELSAAEVSKGGIVREQEKRDKAVDNVRASAASLRLRVLGVVPSVLKGAAGNQEYFLLAETDEE